MPFLAPHIPLVPASGIRRIFQLSQQLEGITSLVIGEPDVAVAPHIAAAAKQAWDDDLTDYTDNGGIRPFRDAIVEKLARENSMRVKVEQVWVTVGATQGLNQAMHLLLAAGDEVLVPDPGYTTFTMTARLLNATPVPYSLRVDRDFMPDLEELESLITERTRVLIINSPSNPLGTVLPEPVLRELLDFASRHDLWIISDEVYEYFTWDEPHISIASLDREDRVFTAFSLSKTYAMTGIRVGYLVTPPGLTDIMRNVQETTISCVDTPAQYAAIAAITGDHTQVVEAREHYRENIAAATRLLDERGIRYLRPTGAFYLWIDVSTASRGDVAAWAETFLVYQRVAVAPGTAFGASGEGWIRVSLAVSHEILMTGLGKLPAPAVTA
ncbi:pyridoxal phosphate-dependent aminotransferase [Glaciihabitans sp. dw_435]|uniref:pyridoxal phosphate-dependent aminotransferase n=1 Tax=Glaciihabitans sp. dw_435 TaxID=2720081 RepID=UPI001BD59044|nr:aminotransferase class I/II-fold pyridoxal phosphate-dependent enzyme [Glaciihabitans sp. dw_435]